MVSWYPVLRTLSSDFDLSHCTYHTYTSEEMVLEAIMICIDNSDWARNGDYVPTRLEAEIEAVQCVANAKINSNAETTVGLLSMAGGRIQVHTSPTRSIGSIMAALAHQVRAGGKANFIGGLKTAQLALKNRPNKNQRQRIVCFVGSPIDCDIQVLTVLGKQLKKNNVAVDVVNFGAENTSNENAEKLEALINSVSNSDNSHLINIPPGPHILSDLVLTSPIVIDADSRAAQQMAGGSDFGIDADADPELATVIRMSLEEERLRQERAGAAATAAEPLAAATTAGTVSNTAASDDVAMNEDEELQRAILISQQLAESDASNRDDAHMQDQHVSASSSSLGAGLGSTESASAGTTSAAISSTTTPSANISDDASIDSLMQDQEFISSLLSTVPGIDFQSLQTDQLLRDLHTGTSNGGHASESENATSKDTQPGNGGDKQNDKGGSADGNKSSGS